MVEITLMVFITCMGYTRGQLYILQHLSLVLGEPTSGSSGWWGMTQWHFGHRSNSGKK